MLKHFSTLSLIIIIQWVAGSCCCSSNKNHRRRQELPFSKQFPGPEVWSGIFIRTLAPDNKSVNTAKLESRHEVPAGHFLPSRDAQTHKKPAGLLQLLIWKIIYPRSSKSPSSAVPLNLVWKNKLIFPPRGKSAALGCVVFGLFSFPLWMGARQKWIDLFNKFEHCQQCQNKPGILFFKK